MRESFDDDSALILCNCYVPLQYACSKLDSVHDVHIDASAGPHRLLLLSAVHLLRELCQGIR